MITLYVYGFCCLLHEFTTSGAETAYPPEHLSSPPVFSVIHVDQSEVFCVILSQPLFLLYFFLPLSLSFYFWLLITPTGNIYGWSEVTLKNKFDHVNIL